MNEESYLASMLLHFEKELHDHCFEEHPLKPTFILRHCDVILRLHHVTEPNF